MSDASISQEELDKLFGNSVKGEIEEVVAPTNSPFSDSQQRTLDTFLSESIAPFATNFSSLTGKDIQVEAPKVEILDRETFLSHLPAMVVATIIDFNNGLFGDHIFVMSADFAQKIVGLINKEEISEIDDMALSIMSETISQHVGSELSTLEKHGIRDITTIPAESVHVPKVMVRLPSSKMVVVSYTIVLDGENQTLWEVMPESLVTEIIQKIGGNDPFASQMGSVPPAQPQMGVMNMAGMPGSGNGPNVQSVQYHPLQSTPTETEQGNIGLIMDVYMEVTVELGRTRMMIKDILGMGEGHIIELDKLAGEPVDILVNHKPIAKGEVVVIDENFGVRVTEILSPMERITEV